MFAGKSDRSAETKNWLRNQDWNLGADKTETISRAWRILVAEAKHLFGIDSRLANRDRRILEDVIFPYFLDDDTCRTVLFVGCSWCTRGYNRYFEKAKNYWTIDSSPLKRRYGAKQHIVGSLEELGQYTKPETFDLIVCNGVYGWGLNKRDDIEAAFTACRDALRQDGVLVIGWNDIEHLNPCPPSTWQCLNSFRPFVFPPLGSVEFIADTTNRHTYSFYRRPRLAEMPAQTG